MGTGLHSPPDYSKVAYPTTTDRIDLPPVQFGDVLELHSYQTIYQPEHDLLQLDLHWQVVRQMQAPYFFSALLISPDNDPKTAIDWQPFEYQFPTTCWHTIPDEILLLDRVQIELPKPYPQGEWWISLSVFSYQNGIYERLMTESIFGADDQFGLGPVYIGQ